MNTNNSREEEINQAVESEYFPTKAEEFAWIHGAEWADQNPRKGLWDSEKVIEWLKVNLEKFGCFNCFIEDHKVEPDIIEALKQAMEE